MEKKLNGNYTRILRPILNKSWRQHPTKQKLYGHLPPIMETIKVRWTRHARHCWRSQNKLISDILLWIPSHGQAKAGRPASTYIQQLCADTGWSLEDLPEVIANRGEGQGDPCWWHNMMMMMINFENQVIFISIFNRVESAFALNIIFIYSSITKIFIMFVYKYQKIYQQIWKYNSSNSTEIGEKYKQIIFITIQGVFTKSIKTEAVFTNREMNNECNINFLQNCSLPI